MAVEKVEGILLLLSAGLGHDDGQFLELGFDFIQGQESRPGGQDGRLDHGMLGPVEAEEIAQPARMDHLNLNAHAFLPVIDGANAKLVITASVVYNEPLNLAG